MQEFNRHQKSQEGAKLKTGRQRLAMRALRDSSCPLVAIAFNFAPWRLGVRSSPSVTSVVNPDFNQMKQNDISFCCLMSVNRPGFLGPIAHGNRQNGRIMSPKTGSPAAATKCNRWPPNDLRPAPRNGRKQNLRILERQHVLLPTVADPRDKRRPCTPQPLVVYKRRSPKLPVFCCSVLPPGMNADTVLMRTVD